MSQKKVIIIRGSSLDRETRATKIIKKITENGYSAHLLWWSRGSTLQRSERGEAGTKFSESFFKLKAPLGLDSLLVLPFWWIFILHNLMMREWDLAHAIQVISLPPAIIAGKIRRKPVIYDMLDTYEDSIILPQMVRNILVAVDKLCIKAVDGVILADEEQVTELNGIPNDNVVVVYDSPDTTQIIYKNQRDNDVFTIFYGGALDSRKKLNLDVIIHAVEQIEGVRLTIAGYGDMVPEIRKAASMNNDKIEYIGEITHAEVLQRSMDADLLFVLRDSVLPVNKYICGSKVLEAMMCGTAIMVSDGTSTAKKVKKYDMGVVVNPHCTTDVKNAISELHRNKAMCDRHGSNAALAYKTEYNWDYQGEKLLALYKTVV